ncbi:hypothetical protein COOONC_00066 [Cooperia oncophora]
MAYGWRRECSRTLWPLAIITKINTSQDGALRSVQVKTIAQSTSWFRWNSMYWTLRQIQLSRKRQLEHLLPPPRIQPPRVAKRTHSR